MRIAYSLALALALSLVGCGGKKDDKGGGGSGGSAINGSSAQPTGSGGGGGSGSATGSGSAANTGSGGAGSGSDMAAGSGSAATGSGAGSGSDSAVTMQHGAGNCPSAVLGAQTKAEVKGKDVVLTISSTDKDAIAAIQKRTEELLKEKADGATSGMVHDQKGSHGGATGMCPVYWPEGGKATSKKDAKGAIVTITPKDHPEDLKKTIDARIEKTAAWVKDNIKPGDQGNKGGVGGGKGEHGSTHSGQGDGKGKERKGGGTGGGAGTGGGGQKGTGGGGGLGGKTDPKKEPAGGW